MKLSKQDKNKINKINDRFLDWNSVHINYSVYEHNILGSQEKIIADEYKWRKDVLSNSPKGHLLLNNSFFDTKRNQKKVYLAHVTPNFHNITKDSSIFPSSGCLVASIYCTPLYEENGLLRLHNLGRYILEQELPSFAKNFETGSDTPLETLLFEIDIPHASRGNLIGTDYLRLGNIHCQTFKDLEYLLSAGENDQIKKSCVVAIRKSIKYLSICNNIYYSGDKINPSDFLNIFIESIHTLPILGYFYFEILSEYIMLFQDNQKSDEACFLGEFYTPSYKDLAFSLTSHLLKHFSLTRFTPSIEKVTKYIETNKVFKKLDRKHFMAYMTERLIYLTNSRLLDPEKGLIGWGRLCWDFDELCLYLKPLIGHLIHRELRSFGRYPDFYFYFDQVKALQIWNYWNQLDIVVPFNGIIPKGEVGINPAYPNLKYKTYRGKSVNINSQTYLEPTEELNIRIVPRLVDPRFTAMGENKKEISN